MYTTASVFFKTLADAGITHAFVNWGNDHPAFLEDIERQKAEGDGKPLVEIVTCPSEMVALSAAQGYGQVTGKPAVVIVHVDVGTQSLAGAVHNADRGRTPVLIFSGAPPHSAHRELKGSKNEWPMWSQDIPDQPAIVRQYMRHTAQLHSGKTASKVILRALQFATSQPKGPVYLWAHREVLEEELEETAPYSNVNITKWPALTGSGLSPTAVDTIVTALLEARFPQIIVGGTGQNPNTVPLLEELSLTLAISIFAACPSAVPVSYNHPYLVGSSFLGKNEHLSLTDVVLILDTDIPWIEAMGTKPQEDARVFVVDCDPLKQSFGWAHVDAEMLCRADTEVALGQILEAVHRRDGSLVTGQKLQDSAVVKERGLRIEGLRAAWLNEVELTENQLASDNTTPTAASALRALRTAVQIQTPSKGEKVLWMNEGVSNCGLVWNHIRPTAPGSMFMSGGASLGWSLGASIGASLGTRVAEKGHELIVAIMGDGNFVFGAPTAAYWMARRYNTPFLTLILNNGGWASPKNSMLGVHPHGHGSKASARDLSISFGPDNPDYGQVAAAAGGAWCRRVARAEDVQVVIEEAIRVVLDENRSAVVDCLLETI